ncbi:MAG: hypothetical protein OHK0037_12920 [Elainellaceae cyanobacterium]
MAQENWQTDEDRMIARLEAHRDLITWVIEQLRAEGISCDRTIGNDSHGDILYYHAEDESKVKAIVRQMNAKWNSP